MKLNRFLLLTHLATALVAAICFAAANQFLASGFVVPCLLAAVALLVVGGVSWLVAWRFQSALRLIETLAATADVGGSRSSGWPEFDATAQRVAEYAQRWAAAVAGAREQFRDIEALVASLDRRSITDSASRSMAVRLRQALTGLAHTMDNSAEQVVTCVHDIDRCTQEIARGCEDQADVVSKTTTYVEQMSANIDSVSSSASAASHSATAAKESAERARELVTELLRGMDRIRAHVASSESKLRALGDRSHEIGSIVEMIGAISARTDLLALNASIESVRAGEHGRGFAVVAEEVRKLAEQTAQATREVAALIESTQRETQESMSAMAKERTDVENEIRRVHAAQEALDHISRIAGDSSRKAADISQATQQQLQLTREVVLAVERIANAAKSSRSRAERACWSTKSLSKMVQQLTVSLAPVRASVGETAPRAAEINLASVPEEAEAVECVV